MKYTDYQNKHKTFYKLFDNDIIIRFDFTNVLSSWFVCKAKKYFSNSNFWEKLGFWFFGVNSIHPSAQYIVVIDKYGDMYRGLHNWPLRRFHDKNLASPHYK